MNIGSSKRLAMQNLQFPESLNLNNNKATLPTPLSDENKCTLSRSDAVLVSPTAKAKATD
jgi:hypothetical protein